MFGILEAFEWRYTPLQILDTEQAYPGLWNDMVIMAWQKRLIKEEQMDQEAEEQA